MYDFDVPLQLPHNRGRLGVHNRGAFRHFTQVYDVMKKKERLQVPSEADGTPGSQLELAETLSMINASEGGKKSVVEFTAARSAILEREQKVRVSVRRYGRLDCTVTCKYVQRQGGPATTVLASRRCFVKNAFSEALAARVHRL